MNPLDTTQINTTADYIITLISVHALSVAGALLLLVIGWWAAGFIGKRLRRVLSKTQMTPLLIPLVANSVKYTILAFVLVAVLAQFGVQTTSLIAALGAAGLAVALALQGALSNIAAGIMLIVLKPFKVGDFVDVNGTMGIVDEVGFFATELHTYDNLYLMVPNAQIWGQTIKNFSRNNTRMIEMIIGISYESSLEKAFDVLNKLAAKHESVLETEGKKPLIFVDSYGDNSVNLKFRCWTDTKDYFATANELRGAIKPAFDAAGIDIPFPQRTVRIVSEADEVTKAAAAA